MIQSIEIKNLRGIQEGKLEGFTPLTILVGPNGSGKSTILDALLLGASPYPTEAMRVIYQQRLRIGGSGVRWLIRKAATNQSAEIRVRTDRNNTHILKLTSNYLPETSPSIRFSLVEGDNTLILGQLAEQSDNYASNEHFPLDGLPEIHLIDLQDKDRPPLHKLFSAVIQHGLREEVQAIVSAIVPDMSHLEILTEGDIPLINITFEGTKGAIPAVLAGDGTYALLRLCLALASQPGGVVLLEEPEVHQHPGAIGQSAKAIMAAVRRNIQVIISTHSLELIDRLLNEVRDDEELTKLSVFGLKLDNGCLKSYHLEGSDVALLRTQVETDLR